LKNSNSSKFFNLDFFAIIGHIGGAVHHPEWRIQVADVSYVRRYAIPHLAERIFEHEGIQEVKRLPVIVNVVHAHDGEKCFVRLTRHRKTALIPVSHDDLVLQIFNVPLMKKSIAQCG